MSLFGFIRSELIDLIEWLEDDRDTMVYRFVRHDNEIKNGAKLIVRESQVAALVSEGKLADVFFPGTHTLSTQNVPILSTLRGWKYGFDSPFKVEVYFVSMRTFTDRKWGTKNPIMLRDAEFGVVRLRAFGSYLIRVKDAMQFLREVVGTAGRFNSADISEQLRDMVVARFSDVLGESRIPALDLAANYDELGKFVTQRMHDDFGTFGLELVKLIVENISLPPEVEAAMDKRASMGVIGNLAAYTQYQAATAMEAAAKNPGGTAGDLASAGIGAAMGLAMAGQTAGAFAQPTAPPPLPQPAAFFVAPHGQQAGPFDLPILRQKVTAGEIARDTLVWKQGLASWTPAGQVAELAALFATVPPPLPPA